MVVSLSPFWHPQTMKDNQLIALLKEGKPGKA